MEAAIQIPSENLIVYGLGGAFHWFHEIFMVGLGYRPAYLVDRKASEGFSADGIPVINDLASRIEVSERHLQTVVVCVGNEGSFLSIQRELSGLGFTKILWVHQLYEIHDPFGIAAARQIGERIKIRRDDIDAARRLLTDDLSLRVFDSVLETHRTQCPQRIPSSPAGDQYYPGDIGIDIALDRMVMCGADHDTLIQLSHRVSDPTDYLMVFEADPRWFQRFTDSRNIAQWIGDVSRTTRSLIVSPCAVSAQAGSASFISSAHTTFGSRLSPVGTATVQKTTLDQSVHGLCPTYVCADIEGEEIAMLQGAQSIIRAGKTSFAICAYHDASHLWEIPNLIHQLNPDYRFFVRNYTGFCMETVIYAIPRG